MSEPRYGAEAEVINSIYLGRDSVIKTRIPKSYRVKELDDKLRVERMRNEARLMREARRAGVRTPVVYDIDPVKCGITMEKIQGVTVKEYLDSHPEEADKICMEIGKNIGLLHNNRISHGDLTTSNMILESNGDLCIIDFSMGALKADMEELGVDIRLMERAFDSAHPGMDGAYGKLLESYCEIMSESRAVMNKVKDIKSRGRYT